MAKTILRDVYIEVDGVELSDHGNHVEITSDKPLVDVTGFGAQSTENDVGIGTASIAVTLLQDFDAGSVDATLWPIHQNDTPVSVIVRPTSAVVSETNPQYQMTGILPTYSPLSGDLNAVSTVQVTFQNASQSGITRTTV